MGRHNNSRSTLKVKIMARKNTKTVDPQVDETLNESLENKTEVVEEGKVPELENKVDPVEGEKPALDKEEKSKEQEGDKIPENVEELMRLYPQYEQFYVTPKGYLRPVGTPKYLLEGAVLYKNKFFNK